tara:strand:+ start:109 stop:438 length:330 start_codon:yes stop_codon:yes gene_type:complete
MDPLGLEWLMAQLWFDQVRDAQGMNRVPFDDPEHKYDNLALYRAGFKPSDVGPDGHLPSYYKDADHPNRFVHDPDWHDAQKDKDLNVIYDKNRKPLRDTKKTSLPWRKP